MTHELKTVALQQALIEHKWDALITGIRRDEDPTRAKERYFSPRNAEFEWAYKDQPPEFWGQFATTGRKGEHIRVQPLLDWTEVDIWRYILREKIPILQMCFARDGQRYRSLGCQPMHAAPRQLALALAHTESFAREDFLSGPSNASALALIDAWPDWPSGAVVLAGPEGSGKSHLAAVWVRPRARALSPRAGSKRPRCRRRWRPVRWWWRTRPPAALMSARYSPFSPQSRPREDEALAIRD